MIDRKYDISLVIGAWQEEYYRDKLNLDSKVNLIVLDIPNNSISRNFWFLFCLSLLVRRLRPDKIIFTYPIPFIKLLLCNNIKTYSIIHDLYPFTNPENFRFAIFNKLFTANSIYNSDKLVVVSQQTRKEILGKFPNLSKDIILQYIPMHFSEKIFNTPNSKPYFLCVAQHTKNKNINLVIDIYANFLLTYNCDWDLVIIGTDGSESKLLKQMLDNYDISNKVFFLSNLTSENLISYYQNCEIFMLLSSNEGLGIPLVEALFYSKYIICTDIPVFKEIDTENINFINLKNPNLTDIVYSIPHKLKPNLKRLVGDKRFDLRSSNKQHNFML